MSVAAMHYQQQQQSLNPTAEVVRKPPRAPFTLLQPFSLVCFQTEADMQEMVALPDGTVVSLAQFKRIQLETAQQR